mmetsp:Transcript_44510/g.112157  ORF Transcript_44510/g.112157 Transcript_44510/m.112157 type:complete len:265 (-) Transcript_44510:131-925(-)
MHNSRVARPRLRYSAGGMHLAPFVGFQVELVEIVEAHALLAALLAPKHKHAVAKNARRVAVAPLHQRATRLQFAPCLVNKVVHVDVSKVVAPVPPAEDDHGVPPHHAAVARARVRHAALALGAGPGEGLCVVLLEVADAARVLAVAAKHVYGAVVRHGCVAVARRDWAGRVYHKPTQRLGEELGWCGWKGILGARLPEVCAAMDARATRSRHVAKLWESVKCTHIGGGRGPLQGFLLVMSNAGSLAEGCWLCNVRLERTVLPAV